MIRQPIKRSSFALLGVLSLLLILGGYTLLSYRQHQKLPDDKTIPTWGQMLDGVRKATAAHEHSGERWIVEDSKVTLTRLSKGLLSAVLGSILLGLLMGCFATFEALLAAPMAFFAKVPPTAALPVFFVLVGIDMEMYVAIIVFGVLPSLSQTVYLAVREVPDELLYKSYTLGASNTEIVWNVIARAILPKLIDSIRLQIGPAMVYLIAAEALVADEGFGYRIRLQWRLLGMNVLYPYLATLAMFGFAMDYALRWAQKLLCPWYVGERS